MEHCAGRQLVLNLGYTTSYDRENLVLSRANCAAIEFIDQWPRWRSPITVLIGASGSGKSHIAALWQKKAGAYLCSSTKSGDRSLEASVEKAISGHSILLEDIGESQFQEISLFHLINAIKESFSMNKQTSLLITSCNRPVNWPVSVADLASRLRAVNLIEIGPPDDLLLKGVLIKLLADRQIMVDSMTLDYILKHVERSLLAINRLVNEIDRATLTQKKRPNRQFVANILDGMFLSKNL